MAADDAYADIIGQLNKLREVIVKLEAEPPYAKRDAALLLLRENQAHLLSLLRQIDGQQSPGSN